MSEPIFPKTRAAHTINRLSANASVAGRFVFAPPSLSKKSAWEFVRRGLLSIISAFLV